MSVCRVSTAADGVLPPSWCPKGMFLLTSEPVWLLEPISLN